MSEMRNGLESISVFVGTGECNAACGHCAGAPLRKYAPKRDGSIDSQLIWNTLADAYEQGARYLSISSSGEPTLSPMAVTQTLDIIQAMKYQGKLFSPVNLYSNGIRIGNDNAFAKNYLPLWQHLGLTTVYITVHDTDEKKNVQIYNVEKYPELDLIIKRIHDAQLLMRANIILGKPTVNTFDQYRTMIDNLLVMGVDYISSWPIRNLEDKVDTTLAPEDKELIKMKNWVEMHPQKSKIRLLTEESKIAYSQGRKLTLFPNGVLSSTWCN